MAQARIVSVVIVGMAKTVKMLVDSMTRVLVVVVVRVLVAVHIFV